MEVKLTPEMERWVAEQVGAGRFVDAGEVVKAALLMLQRRVEKHEALRRAVQAGLEQAERGELLDGEEVFERVFERIAAHEAAA